MSLTKRSQAFQDMMEEQRRDEDNSHTLYLETLYLRGITPGPKPPAADDEHNDKNQPKGTIQPNDEHDN